MLEHSKILYNILDKIHSLIINVTVVIINNWSDKIMGEPIISLQYRPLLFNYTIYLAVVIPNLLNLFSFSQNLLTQLRRRLLY